MDSLIGKKLVSIQPLTRPMAEQFGFDPWGCESAVVLVFEDGTILVPSRDPEGNGPGCIFGRKGSEHFMLLIQNEIRERLAELEKKAAKVRKRAKPKEAQA